MWVAITAVATILSCDKALFFIALCSGWEALSGIGPSCEGFRFLGVTLLILGAVIMINTFLCLLSASPDWQMVPRLFWIAVLTAFAIFAVAVSSNGGGKLIPGRPYKEYRVEWYSKWMQHKVNDAHHWDTYYKTAIVQAHVCTKFSTQFELDILDAIHTRKLTPFQSSCCMPPEDCGFNFTSPTVWVKPESGNYTDMVDCNRWDNDPNTLCYDCQTCKAAFLQDVTTQYFISGMALFASPLKEWLAILGCGFLCGIMMCVGTLCETIIGDLRRCFGRGVASSGDDYIPIEGI
ncbi:Tetraspanin-7 [Bienertia sinuspersici]